MALSGFFEDLYPLSGSHSWPLFNIPRARPGRLAHLQGSGISWLSRRATLRSVPPQEIVTRRSCTLSNMLVERDLFGILALEIVTFRHVSLAGQKHGRTIYSRDQLLALMPASLASRVADTPAEIRRKTHRGCRGGSQSRGKRTGSRQQRLMEKRSSVGNKMDEFTALARCQRTFREWSVCVSLERGCTRTYLIKTSPWTASKPFGLTGSALRAVSVKELGAYCSG
ncbi:uncharacterized protein LOC134349663 isoform X2 [Mobula hypostoma]|uniref:uncharacterized protein LOC134349663 isoform X2 n=1 Tax=Mobula hypostoma TaxID=723540 RepID=UPI002FC39AD2